LDESISTIANLDQADDESIKYPYTYQKKIVDKILNQWQKDESVAENFGSIIFIETGAGKSYISLMLIKSLFGERHDRLSELNPE
jgi:CRISPR/Cas system-associated endonuclease/helicase Cas3